MTGSPAALDLRWGPATLVPDEVGEGEKRMTVSRAWPTTRVDEDGRRALAVEGRDDAGRLRAGRVWMVGPDEAEGVWQAQEIKVLPSGVDHKLPDLQGWSVDGDVVVHRFGKRAVVATDEGYVKVVRPEAARRVVAQAGQGYLVAQGAGFDAPRVTGLGSGWVQCSTLPGESWHDWGMQSPDQDLWARSWRAWARRWPLLVTQDAEVAGIQEHAGPQEQANLSRWTEAVATWSMLPPELRPDFDLWVQNTLAELGKAGQPLVLAHRDLHDKQVLVDPSTGRLGLLDFDTAAWAEPALDLANLAVHIGLRLDQGLWSEQHAAIAQEQVQEVRQALGVSDDRFEAYAEATRIRLACLYLFRPRYRELALRWAAQGA